MRNTPNQGLAGKARRQQFRSRSSRLHDQQLIEDYLEQGPSRGGGLADGTAPTELGDRPIPIGHRREFVPTAEPSPDDSAAGQLEFSLTPTDDNDDVAFVAVPRDEETRIKVLAPRAEERNAAGAASARTMVETASATPAIRDAAGPDHRAGIRKSAQAEACGSAAATEPFTMPGFLFGCAIGTAAATVVLVCFRIALA